MNQQAQNGGTQVPGGVIKGKLNTEELLKLENLSLRVQNLALQEQRLQQDLMRSNEMRRGYQAELEKMKNELGEKFGVNFTASTTILTPDGAVIDQTPPPAPAPVSVQASPPQPDVELPAVGQN